MAEGQDRNALPQVDAHNMAMLQAVGALLNGKAIPEHSIPEQREIFRKIQFHELDCFGVSVSHSTVQTSHGEVVVYVFKHEGSRGDLPFIFFIHGGGWIIGSVYDFEPFILDLVRRTGLALVFPEYTLAPEKKFPAQQEQCLEVLQHVVQNASQQGLLAEKIAIVCDSVGGIDPLLEGF